MLGSRHLLIMNAIAATLNSDADLAPRNFLVRKKPYNKGPSWNAGAFVSPAPMPYDSPYHETTEDELVFKTNVVVVDPTDSDLVAQMGNHMGAIERVQEIFRLKAHSFMPDTMKALDAAFAADVALGKYGATKMQMVTVAPDRLYADSAFEAGYDASGCVISVRVLCSRYNSTGL